MSELDLVRDVVEFTAADAVGAILFIYWLLAGVWLFFIQDDD